ncbi:MAG: IS1634 family transposase, partial [Candidatus Bipolaricaulota bacterium]|nr:IS1634 family transposase [Candidatus Bipolaricaulota bacterium]
MHIDIVPSRNSKPTILLRESYREGGKVKKHTLANLSKLSMDQVQLFRQVLKGEQLVLADALFDVSSSQHHRHIQAVRTAMKRLRFDNLLASRCTRERDLVVAMVVTRILEPESKLATTRWWHTTTLPDDLGVADATEDDLYQAMDWLLDRQGHIEKKLAIRHLSACGHAQAGLEEGGLVLYDLSSSYFEGVACPLAARGYNRDKKKGKLQVNYGLLTNRRGCPVSISVFPGNSGDPKTLLGQVTKIKEQFKLDSLVLVGDRLPVPAGQTGGMISQKQIDKLSGIEGIDWITALRGGQISKLMQDGTINMSLFDERDLYEFTHRDFPGERLVVCRNPLMAERRVRTRQSLIEATVQELEKVRGMVKRGGLKAKEKIGVRVGKVVNKYKVAKHFQLVIEEGQFSYHLLPKKVAEEAAMDGLYVIRTSLSKERMTGEEAVRSYKRLSTVERAFRSLKGIDLKVRPTCLCVPARRQVYHHLEDRVRAHIFLCMLAYYVEWHMKEAWRELLFS